MRRLIQALVCAAILSILVGAIPVEAREEAIQSASLPSARVEIDPKADYGPDAPPPYYPLEEINQNVFRGVRHGFVNTTTGNLAFGVLDLKLPGRMPIEFRRVYDSGISSYLPPPPPHQPNEPRWNVDLGLNWALGYASYLIPLTDGVLMATPEGDVVWWTEQTGGVFVRPYEAPTRHMKLVRQSQTVLVETQLDGTVWTYTWTGSASGTAYVLTEIKDRSNNKITLTYNQGYLSHIQNTDGAYIDIFRPLFDSNYPTTIFPRVRVTKLTDSTGRIVRFDYDSAGRLIKATDALAKDWTYGYDATTSKLLSATNPLGQVYLNATYDSSMRTATYEANAGPWSFAYDQSGKTTATDGLGHVWEYTPGTSGITVAVKEPTLGQHTLTLNSANNPITYTGPLGELASWTYDSGALAGETDAAASIVADVEAAEGAEGIRITQKGLDIASEHLAQFGEYGPNQAMLDRLGSAVGSRVTGADANFYLHEISESTMMGRDMSYEAAHAAAIEKYAVSPFSLYHPEVIQQFPGEFNNAWRAFWGIQ